MKLLRKALIGLAVLLGLSILIAAAGFVVLGSEWGAQRVLRAIESRSDGLVSIESISGTLAGGTALEGIEISTGAATIDIDRMAFDIELRGLLARALVIDALEIGRIEYAGAPRHDEAPAGGAASPILVLVREVAIDSIAAEVDGTFIEVGATTMAVRVVDDAVDLEGIETHYQNLELRGDFGMTMGDPLVIALDACADGLYRGEPISACVELEGELGELAASGTLIEPYTAEAAGTLSLEASPTFDLEVEWSDVVLFGEPEVRSDAGRARLTGGLDSFRVAGGAAITYDGRESRVDLEAVTDLTVVVFEALTLRTELGTVEGSGELEIESLALTFDFEADDLDPSVVLPDWPGDLDASGAVRARLFPEPELMLDDLVVSGSLRDYPVTITGGVDYAVETWTLRAVSLASRSDRIEIDGRIGESLALGVSADVGDVGLVWPGLEGAASAAARIGGALGAPTLEGRVDVRDLAYQGIEAARVTIEGSAGFLGDATVDLGIHAEGFTGLGLRIDAADVRLDGSAGDHTAMLSATAGGWRLDAGLDGRLEAADWDGRLLAFTIDVPSLGPWRLAEPASLAVGGSGVDLPRSCLRRGEAEICIEADVAGGAQDVVRIDASEFDLETLAPFLPEGVSGSGRYTLALVLSDPLGNPEGELRVSGSGTELAFEFTEEETVVSTFDDIELAAALMESRLTLNGSVRSAETGEATVALVVEDIEAEDSPVDGEIDIEWRDTQVISLLSPEVGDVGGILFASMTLAGNLDAPRLEGSARWNGGRLEVPVWGFAVENVTAEATSADASVLEFQATGTVLDSMLTVDGQIELDAAAGFPAVMRLHGDAVPIVNRSDAQVVVSPDLEATVRLPRIDVSGTVEVPSARLALIELPEQAVAPSADAVVHGEAEEEEIRPLDVHANIRLRLGEDVRYASRNLEATLRGQLDLEYESGSDATARGNLEIGGTYNAYQTPLALERGRLIFAGPIDNPGLDVRATRHIDEITVGVQLRGTLREPQTRIFSEPVMGEAEALSYLLFGRPLERSEDQDSQILQAAAVSMGLQQALPVIQRIGESLGFDEFTVRPTDTDAGALMAGKYLSPRLYIRYSYGLFNRIGGLLLRFRINDRLSLETQSGEQKSMDLLYTVEKN